MISLRKTVIAAIVAALLFTVYVVDRQRESAANFSTVRLINFNEQILLSRRDELHDFVDGGPSGRSLGEALVSKSFDTMLAVSGKVAAKGPGADTEHPGSVVLGHPALGPDAQNLLKLHFSNLLKQLRPSHDRPPSTYHDPDRCRATTADSLRATYTRAHRDLTLRRRQAQ